MQKADSNMFDILKISQHNNMLFPNRFNTTLPILYKYSDVSWLCEYINTNFNTNTFYHPNEFKRCSLNLCPY